MGRIGPDGILLIDKEEGQPSYGVVKEVKSALKGSQVGKVGHAGTLDPFATGLLIILLGQGTKISQWVMSQDKIYLATMRLGVETDTLDPTGQVVRTSVVPDLDPGFIREKSRSFIGPIEQVPPRFSAVKYKGTRAYKLARRGMAVDLKKRTVMVHSLSILSVNLPDVTMEIRCSSGTYVRSLAADLGRVLGPGGHLGSLRRLASGSFEVRNALKQSEIRAGGGPALLDRVIFLRAALPQAPEIDVDRQTARKVRQGGRPDWNGLKKEQAPAFEKEGHA
ncbi:MAG: tRNA pseudouridine(55) synthase TruB, partial [Deltaproteobacteria bacterium]|nr:tRNA pseudouridine(55) synthase TruB [Deltaproteobacteria bacterium]